MLKILKTAIVGAAIFLSMGICNANDISRDTCRYHTDSEFLTEDNNVENVAHGIVNGVFFMRVFNGLWPIPDRYQVYGYEHESISLHSPYDMTNMLGIDCPIKTVGFISFGNYGVYKRIYDEKPNLHDQVTVEQIGRYTLELHHVSFVKRKLNYVLIHDDSEYIKITDENQNLWRVMFDTFKKINVQKK